MNGSPGINGGSTMRPDVSDCCYVSSSYTVSLYGIEIFSGKFLPVCLQVRFPSLFRVLVMSSYSRIIHAILQ